MISYLHVLISLSPVNNPGDVLNKIAPFIQVARQNHAVRSVSSGKIAKEVLKRRGIEWSHSI